MKQYTFEERNVHTVTCPKRQIFVDCTIQFHTVMPYLHLPAAKVSNF